MVTIIQKQTYLQGILLYELVEKGAADHHVADHHVADHHAAVTHLWWRSVREIRIDLL